MDRHSTGRLHSGSADTAHNKINKDFKLKEKFHPENGQTSNSEFPHEVARNKNDNFETESERILGSKVHGYARTGRNTDHSCRARRKHKLIFFGHSNTMNFVAALDTDTHDPLGWPKNSSVPKGDAIAVANVKRPVGCGRTAVDSAASIGSLGRMRSAACPVDSKTAAAVVGTVGAVDIDNGSNTGQIHHDFGSCPVAVDTGRKDGAQALASVRVGGRRCASLGENRNRLRQNQRVAAYATACRPRLGDSDEHRRSNGRFLRNDSVVLLRLVDWTVEWNIPSCNVEEKWRTPVREKEIRMEKPEKNCDRNLINPSKEANQSINQLSQAWLLTDDTNQSTIGKVKSRIKIPIACRNTVYLIAKKLLLRERAKSICKENTLFRPSTHFSSTNEPINQSID